MRIAVFVHGGVTEQESRYSIPYIREFVSLLSENHDVYVYCANNYEAESKEYLLGQARIRYIFTSPSSSLLPAAKARAMLAGFVRDLRTARFDITHGVGALPGGLTAILAARRAKIPSVTTLIGGELVSIPELDYGNMRRQPQRMLTRFVCSRTNAVVLLTRHQERLLADRRMRTKGTAVIPYGVNNALFRPLGDLRLVPPYHILHIGTLIALKDQETLLRAFAIARRTIDCTLRIIGNDYFNGKIQRLAHELDVAMDVEFIPHVHNSELPQYYNWAHMYLQTSLSEGQSVACTEAMACGTVIGGTSVGILNDLAPESAFAVAIRDHQALGAKIVDVLTNANEYNRLRTSGLEWSRSHTSREMVGRHEQLYASLMQRRPKAVHAKA